ncbi:hypothetical protein EDC04DRAFT_2667421 [Pisolithus marmoratus]|nr:hypothetical protein EDC04DRAFT_2667421 [Pisolithus marmoratus]
MEDVRSVWRTLVVILVRCTENDAICFHHVQLPNNQYLCCLIARCNLSRTSFPNTEGLPPRSHHWKSLRIDTKLGASSLRVRRINRAPQGYLVEDPLEVGAIGDRTGELSSRILLGRLWSGFVMTSWCYTCPSLAVPVVFYARRLFAPLHGQRKKQVPSSFGLLPERSLTPCTLAVLTFVRTVFTKSKARWPISFLN